MTFIDILNRELLRDAISVAGLGISLFLLFIHLKNRKTQLHSFWLARGAQRSSSIDLVYLSSEQLADPVILKLVLFNPGSIAAIIKSFAVYREVPSSNVFLRLFGVQEWGEVEGARWWPTKDTESKAIKYLTDEYQNLFVPEQRDILVCLPGFIDRNRYRFEIKTNHGGYEHVAEICSTRSYFSHASNQWYAE